MKKLKSLLISLALALVCVSMVISTDVVEAASVRLNKTSITMYTGQTSTLKVSGTSKKVTWSTSNKKVATVSSKGVVSAKSSGSATITARVNNKKAALRAYYYFLKSYKFTFDYFERGFYLAYIDNDSIPELLIFDGDFHAARVHVYSYVNGKVKYVGDFGEYGAFFYKEKKGVIGSTWMNQGVCASTYFKWNGTNLSKIISFRSVESIDYNGNIVYKYYINDKKVTRSKYESSITPYQKGFKYVDLSYSYEVSDSIMKNKLL